MKKAKEGVNLKAPWYVLDTKEYKRCIETCQEKEWPCVMILPHLNLHIRDEIERSCVIIPKIEYKDIPFGEIIKSELLDLKINSLHDFGMIANLYTASAGSRYHYRLDVKAEFREIVAEELYTTLEMLITEIKSNILGLLIKIANKKYGGHFTLMKFTGNWRCCFGTPSGDSRENIYQMEEGKTMDEAIKLTILNDTCVYNFKPLTNQELYYDYKGGTIRK